MDLWPALLGVAVVLNLAELVMRKSKGLLESFRRRPMEQREALEA
jgi:hypothetical protein